MYYLHKFIHTSVDLVCLRVADKHKEEKRKTCWTLVCCRSSGDGVDLLPTVKQTMSRSTLSHFSSGPGTVRTTGLGGQVYLDPGPGP